MNPSGRKQSSPSSFRFFHRLQNSRYATAAPDETLAQLTQLEAHPLWIRLLFFNDLPVGWRLDGAAIALTSQVADGLTPHGENGAPNVALWHKVRFPSGDVIDSDGPLSAPALGDEWLELPANPRESNRPELRFSDWIPVRGPARQDGPGALLLVRAHAASGMRYSGCVGPPDPRIGIVHRGFRIAGASLGEVADGEVVRDDTVFAAYGIEALTSESVLTIMGVGDSIIHSSCTSGELSGFGVRAAVMLSRPGLRVSYVNEGYPGRNSLGFLWNGDWMVRHLRPHVVLIQTWSQNESWDEPTAELAFARAMALADQTRRQGGEPILVTAAPVFADNPEADRHRMNNVDRVRAAGAHGMRVLDLDRLWGMGTSPNAYRPDLSAGDGMHPNDAGCIIAAKALLPILRECLGLTGDAAPARPQTFGKWIRFQSIIRREPIWPFRRG